MSAEAAAPPAAPAAPAATPPAPEAPKPAPDESDTDPGKDEPAPPPEGPKVDVAATVKRAAGAAELAALVREKKALEAQATKYKGTEAKLAALEKIEQLMDDGDRAGAIVELHRLKYGDKAAAELAESYNGLTRHVLGEKTERNPQIAPVERKVSRLEQDFEALKLERDQANAKLAERDAAEQQRWEENAVKGLASYLESATEKHPYLMAEADAPEEVVWAILKEASAQGQDDLTYEQAAELANEHFRPTAEKKAARYQNLLAKKAGGVPIKPEAPPKLTGMPPRKSLTNADASQAAASKDLPPPRTEQERRDRSFAVLQAGLHKP